jgi:hypothetical protein
MNELYTNTICEIGGDPPGWLIAAMLALPVVLIIADILGAR